MKAEKNNRRYYLILIGFIFYSFCINLYGSDSVIKLPNGETRHLTKSEPMVFVTKENGKMTSVQSLNLEEEMDIIVSFKGKPLCLQERSVRLSKKIDIQSEHDAFKRELNRLTGLFQKKMKKTQSLSPDYVIKHEYYRAFNGISLTCKRGIADMIRSLPMVKNVYQDREVRINLDKSVPQIQADRVGNELGLSGEGILVGIVDTGIDYMHPALGGGFGPGFRVIGGYDFINDDADPVDDMFHGTHVAGIVGASSDSLIGVAPGVHFIAAK
ncbi:MAG: S8 family serine peptidase, partial [bacterium]